MARKDIRTRLLHYRERRASVGTEASKLGKVTRMSVSLSAIAWMVRRLSVARGILQVTRHFILGSCRRVGSPACPERHEVEGAWRFRTYLALEIASHGIVHRFKHGEYVPVVMRKAHNYKESPNGKQRTDILGMLDP